MESTLAFLMAGASGPTQMFLIVLLMVYKSVSEIYKNRGMSLFDPVSRWTQRLFAKSSEYVLTVRSEQRVMHYGAVTGDNNTTAIQAVTWKIDNTKHVTSIFDSGDFDVQKKRVLISPDKDSWTVLWSDKNNGERLMFVKKYKDPPSNANNATNAGSSLHQTIEMVFKAEATDFCRAKEIVHRYIQDTVSEYLIHLDGIYKTSRYVFNPACKDGSVSYVKYRMSVSRTFSSFYHPQKDAIVKILDDFQSGAGKFSVPGFPNKLGFLLHGPPGTGKSTFIKTLAAHLDRHIVNVNFGSISTNQQLMDMFFGETFSCGKEVLNIPNNRIIFVMEDIDALGTVVHARTTDAPMFSMKPKNNKKKSFRKDGGDKDEESDNDNESDVDEGDCVPMMMCGPKKKNKDDSLNLSGILNVLDGIVECPGRVIIMTSNHPEKLDPALIRPGRVNMNIYMGPIEMPEAKDMLENYYGKGSVNDQDLRRLDFPKMQMSPALLESLCAQHDTPAEMLAAIN
nr:hypothetical protein TetV2_00336 [Oceanusvirus sp.]